MKIKRIRHITLSIFLTFACSKVTQEKLNSKNVTFFEAFEGKICTIEEQNSSYKTRLYCENLAKIYQPNSDYCKSLPPNVVRLAFFPENRKRPLKLCQKNKVTELTAAYNLRFVVFGDSGVGENKLQDKRQEAVKNLMKKVCTEKGGCNFGIHVGDVIYPNGISSVFDDKFYGLFDFFYNDLNFPIYGTLGNHDHKDNAIALTEIENFSSVWRMPARFYQVPQLPEWLNISVTDTSPIETTKNVDANEWAYLQKHLCSRSEASWSIVVGHHPIYSAGHHGPSKRSGDKLKQLNSLCGFDFYLAGHEHHLQWNLVNKTHFIISGGGGAARKNVTQNQKANEMVANEHGFAIFNVTEKTAAFEFHSLQRFESGSSSKLGGCLVKLVSQKPKKLSNSECDF